jgi:cytochrome c oxidase subunit 2
MSFCRRPSRMLLVVGSAIAALVLSACGADLPATTLHPEGTHAQRVFELLTIVFWFALAVFVLVEVLLVYSVLRFRRRPDSGMPVQIHGNTTVEIAWTVAPALVLLVIAVLTFRTQAEQSFQPPDAVKIQAIGHQWWWEFRYDYNGTEIVTAGDVYVPVGQDVTFEIGAVDVIHSFWAPKLFGKTDAIPGRTNLLSFQALNEGVYRGLCAEFCGEQHAVMRFRVVAVQPDVFQQWLERQATAPAAPSEAVRQVFQQKACLGCHAIGGFDGAVGQSGPNLTYFGDRLTIAGGAADNTVDNLRLWLTDPESMKAHNKMAVTIGPGKVQPTAEEVQLLIDYLMGMKTGIAIPAER